MMPRTRFFAFLIVAATACTPPSNAPLVATDVLVTRPIGNSHMSAGYVTLVNNSDVAAVITQITSPQFESVQMHETVLEGDVSRMHPLEKLVIEPGQTVKLERSGRHLMLVRPLDLDDMIRLNFYSGDTLLLSVSAPLSRTGD